MVYGKISQRYTISGVGGDGENERTAQVDDDEWDR